MNIKSETIAMGKNFEFAVNYYHDESIEHVEVLSVFIEFEDRSKIDITEALDDKQIDYIIKSIYND